MTAPLVGQRILITRAAEQAGDLARLLEMLGATTEEVATIRIAPLEDTSRLDAALIDLSADCWWVFTSANGVRAVCDRLRTLGHPWPPDIRLAAVGPATATALEAAAGRAPDVVPARHDGAALGEALQGLGSGTRVLLPRGDLASPELPRMLSAAGFSVTALHAYRTVGAVTDAAALGERLTAGHFSWVTFASGSAFERLLAALPRRESLQGARLASIGPRTSEIMRARGFLVDAEATIATAEGLVAAIASQTPH